jgi:hypothetical protein
MSQSTGDLLVKSLELMRREGWRVGSVGSLGKPKCAWGAVAYAVGGNFYDEAAKAAMRALSRHTPVDFMGRHRKYLDLDNDPTSAHAIAMCIKYNNSRSSFDEIEEWFEKTAADEGVTQ